MQAEVTLGFNLRIFLSNLKHSQLRFACHTKKLELGFVGAVEEVSSSEGFGTTCCVTLQNNGIRLTLSFEEDEDALEALEALEVAVHFTHQQRTLLKTTVLFKDIVLQPQLSQQSRAAATQKER